MKKAIIFLSIIVTSACYINHPITSFWVSNKTDKTINFKASVIKLSSMGSFEMTLPFVVHPHDSVLVRRTRLIKEGSPSDEFTKFIFFPVDGVKINEPMRQENWNKTINEKGWVKYVFIINNSNK